MLELSTAGALVEGDARLLPGTHVDVHVLTPGGRVLVRSRVVRACVSALSSEQIAYRTALAFEKHVDLGITGALTGYGLPGHFAPDEATQGSRYPVAGA